jgi:inosine-uridine nucleoside N-ribohydrolase
VDVTQGPCRGRTVVDQLARTGNAPNALVATDVDAAGFIDLLTGRIGELP